MALYLYIPHMGLITVSQRHFHVQTFGCQMNINDSEWLSESLKARGFKQTNFEDASIYILHTCSVRDKPEQKVYSELGRIARFCKVRNRQDVTVCVGGCVAQQVGTRLVRRFPQVRLLFGTDGIARAPQAIERLVEEPGLRLRLLDFADAYQERENTWTAGNIPVGAFVNIMQGCDNFCTYCIVPYVRGRQKSRDPQSILQECRLLLAGGTREITLLGQNVNAYGKDRQSEGISFGKLLDAVMQLPGLERLRFLTSHPKDMAPEVIAAFGRSNVLCPRLHLPLQSGSDRILRAMGRQYDRTSYLRLVEALRKARPDMLFSTDVIVGFPGETEQDFTDTLSLMREVGFVASYSFIYSDRPFAKASAMPDKVERQIALERLSRLQTWQEEHMRRTLSASVGTQSVVLLENRSRRPAVLANEADKLGTEYMEVSERETGSDSEEYWQGRTPHGLTVNLGLPPRRDKGWAGCLLPVHIEEAARHSLKGTQAGEPW